MYNRVLIIIVLIFNQIVLGQNNHTDALLYTKIISSNLDKTHDIIVINKYKTNIAYIDEIFDVNTDSITGLDIETMHLYIHGNEKIIHKFANDSGLKKSIIGINKAEDKNKKISLLPLDSVFVKYISARKYISFFKNVFSGKRHIQKGWAKLRKKYNINKVFEFSKVSYSGNYAAVYYSYRCSGLCGSGNIAVFEKVDGEWKWLTDIGLWQS